MNAVLQCLYCCAPITKYFFTLDNSTQFGLVSKGFHDFVKGLFNGNKSAANRLRSWSRSWSWLFRRTLTTIIRKKEDEFITKVKEWVRQYAKVIDIEQYM